MYGKCEGDGRDLRRRRKLNIDKSAKTEFGTSAICVYVLFGKLVEHLVAITLGGLCVIFVIFLLYSLSGCRQLAPAVVALPRIASSIFSHSLFFLQLRRLQGICF